MKTASPEIEGTPANEQPESEAIGNVENLETQRQDEFVIESSVDESHLNDLQKIFADITNKVKENPSASATAVPVLKKKIQQNFYLCWFSQPFTHLGNSKGLR